VSQLANYLERIGLARAPAPDPAGLATLQRAHRLSIPFENLDIHLGRAIRIDSASAFDKLVTRQRGGYCFEQNRVFADMLAQMGVPNRPLLARVQMGRGPGDDHPPRTHMLLLADIAGQAWIADVGFGGSYVPPLPLADGSMATSPDGASHRLRRIGEPGSFSGEWLLERMGPGAAFGGGDAPATGWQSQYSFDLTDVSASDLALANHWTSTAPDTRFTTLHIVTIALPLGFASLSDRSLSIVDDGESQKADIDGLPGYQELLFTRFRLPLDPADLARLQLFA